MNESANFSQSSGVSCRAKTTFKPSSSTSPYQKQIIIKSVLAVKTSWNIEVKYIYVCVSGAYPKPHATYPANCDGLSLLCQTKLPGGRKLRDKFGTLCAI